ncbi:hypothetical protein M569_07244 [Genlisea aurea]|uniref:Uncharacterized protein n=1 Tax=Genlisea aurea TaxID=192259 RepID=S8CLB5_9LAMI|nr:hypothetical protein M569_07244 [Genlisea aurea]
MDEDHPLRQIAENPSHRLLLKQWLKEEELILRRISLKETQIDSTRTQITQLLSLFFLFHSTALLLLFISNAPCTNSWIPSLSSFLSSLAFIWAIKHKTEAQSRLEKLLERELEDCSLLGKCVEELKKKGSEFDLIKEVDALRRAKSLRVQSKRVGRWSGRDFVLLFLFAVSCAVLGMIRIVLCGS